MQELIILAGPNGAGKTTFANQYFPADESRLVFVNADEIARDLADTDIPQTQRDIRAARTMLEQIDALAKARTEFMFETTLASLTYLRKIPTWRKAGYTIGLIYLRLPSVEHSINRVQKRVGTGGHDIPEDVIHRRFTKSLHYFETRYKPLVDEWYVWDSLELDFTLAEAWND